RAGPGLRPDVLCRHRRSDRQRRRPRGRLRTGRAAPGWASVPRPRRSLPSSAVAAGGHRHRWPALSRSERGNLNSSGLAQGEPEILLGGQAVRLPVWIARQIRSDVTGISRCSTPYSASASTSALTATASAGVVPPSPPPRTPRRLVGDGTSLIAVTKDG